MKFIVKVHCLSVFNNVNSLLHHLASLSPLQGDLIIGETFAKDSTWLLSGV